MTNDGFRTALHGRHLAISVLVLVGLLTSACTASSSSAIHVTNTPSTPSSSPAHVTTTERVNFAGFPPEGAHASEPATGNLVLSFQEAGFRPFGEVDLNVYADGRMIWQKWTPSQQAVVVPPGSKAFDTGFVMQRLTPQGIELLRSTIVSTGLFDRNLQLAPRHQSDNSSRTLQMSVLNGGRLVSVDTASLSMTLKKWPKETPAQERTLGRLKAILADAAAWLPPTAWADREIRAFVPSRYLLAYDRNAPDMSKLPTPVRELLLQYKGLFAKNGCQELTTDQARELLGTLVAAGKSPSSNVAQSIDFDVPGVGVSGIPSGLHVSPELPDSFGPTGC